jgi:UDP-N-acetylglucosamine--N-acetylmuramyl-(pentapeptide) pyrophosphoryl-undecaprenol N-acetylglucosamine transferase
MQKDKLKIIISGGGTGGHVFPAIAIANALKKIDEGIDLLFIGAKGRMEMEKVPEAGYAINGLWIAGLQRKLTFKNLLFPIRILVSLIKSNTIINRFKPDVVVGVGGYASGPALRVASWKGIPTLIQEQNSYPGITNKLLAKRARKVCVAYDHMEVFFPANRIVVTGNPVRDDMVNIEGKKGPAMEFFGLKEGRKTLLVIGGSQGALSVNESIARHLDTITDTGLQVIWQTGKMYYPRAMELVQEKVYKDVRAFPFITRMDYAYAAADMVVSRAGAIVVSELCAVKKPVIFIPLPHATEDHQAKNARALAEKEAAVVISDSEAAVSIGTVVTHLVQDERKCARLSENIGRMAHLDAADRIAREIIDLAENKTKTSRRI